MANLQVEFKGNGITKIWSKQYVFDCFIVPRNSVTTSIPDFDTHMAVYFLTNSYESRKEKRHIYVGKTSTGMSRFFSHKSNKDWWDKVFIFTAHEKNFTEDTILGLENLFIKKYTSGLYSMDQEGSNKKIDDDCEYYAEQISNKEEKLVPNVSKSEVNVEASNLLAEFDKRIKDISPRVVSDQLKLYTAYKFDNKNICAAWVWSYGVELELYINMKDITVPNIAVYDITFRKRGRKESGYKICSLSDLDAIMPIINQMIREL